MSCPKSDFAEIAQPRRRRDRGIGEHPNKQENVRPHESGSRAFFRKCIYTCIACYNMFDLRMALPRQRCSAVHT